MHPLYNEANKHRNCTMRQKNIATCQECETALTSQFNSLKNCKVLESLKKNWKKKLKKKLKKTLKKVGKMKKSWEKVEKKLKKS